MLVTREDLSSPIGQVIILSTDGAVIALDFADYEQRMRKLLDRHWPGHEMRPAHGESDAGRRLRDYFAGDMEAIANISTEMRGTSFQQAVWAALRRIPAGATWSYLDLARAAGNQKAVRAAGAANGQNPVAIIHPCHRVIGSSGALTGYAGGLARKRWLLDHERLYSRWIPNGPLFA